MKKIKNKKINKTIIYCFKILFINLKTNNIILINEE
jgi:hypothetical protein